jgi:inner membrane protein YidH
MISPMEGPQLDYRFSLANERTFLAWIRTALALIAGGVAAAKALDWEHDAWRWIVAAPPFAGGALLAGYAARRLRDTEAAMRSDRPLPGMRAPQILGVSLAVFAVVALVASILDG